MGSKIVAVIFGIIFIIILYVIIYYALRIMYKDVKNGDGKRRRTPNQVKKKTIGIEVVYVSIPGDLKKGSVIPVRNDITIGRKEDNSVVLNDQHVSGNHAILSIRNEALVLEDLNSTNGTLVNGKKISGRVRLNINDEIRIGTTKFKVLG
ncbi:MAG: FHA domain-containing protein [Clostridium sp.]|nr:FHA domain-containing protein [Clostridium sp.]MDY3827965.1 FHA domain-containing protein [Clostridium sp.]